MPKVYDLSVVFAPPALMRKLNETYRKKDKAANVLAFFYGKLRLGGRTAKWSGEIFLNVKERDLPHLFAHGCLHFLGYDHKTAQEAQVMEEKEQNVLKKVG